MVLNTCTTGLLFSSSTSIFSSERGSFATIFALSTGEEPYFAIKSNNRETPTFVVADVQNSGTIVWL